MESAGPNAVAFADAFAEGDHEGIGGWVLPPDTDIEIGNVWWLKVQLDNTALPASLVIYKDASRLLKP